MTSGELLQQFIFNITDEESMEKIIFLQDISLCQGIVAWKNMEVDFINEETGLQELSEETWTELWNYSDFDLENFAVFLGKKYSESEEILKRLAFLRFVYPDGRVNKIALSYSRNVSKNMVSKMFSKHKTSKNGDEK